MSPEEPPFSATAVSALDKPLHQLTEDDISQLTREDCRRYLKQKGMRRPSWNKSQAIQQVIMLKALLEPSPDSDDGSRKFYFTSRQQQTPATRVQNGTSADTEISLSAEESVVPLPGHHNDTEKSDFLGDHDSTPPGGEGLEMNLWYHSWQHDGLQIDEQHMHLLDSLAFRYNGQYCSKVALKIGDGTEETKGQMTIFYSGKVNVYDDVPVDKAHALFRLAVSPLQFPQEDSFDVSMLQAPSISVGPPAISPQTVKMTDNYGQHKEESNISRENNSAEGSASRKALVQRYLEKRKDRFKSKRKVGATLDVYANHQIGSHNLNEQSNRSAACSPPPIRQPNTPNRFS